MCIRDREKRGAEGDFKTFVWICIFPAITTKGMYIAYGSYQLKQVCINDIIDIQNHKKLSHFRQHNDYVAYNQ